MNKKWEYILKQCGFKLLTDGRYEIPNTRRWNKRPLPTLDNIVEIALPVLKEKVGIGWRGTYEILESWICDLIENNKEEALKALIEAIYKAMGGEE